MSRTIPAFPFTTHTFAGDLTGTLADTHDGDHGWTTATITGANFFGTGTSRRARLILTADNGTMTGATIHADRFDRLYSDLLSAKGKKVDVTGIVRRATRHATPTIDVTSILPVGTRIAQAEQALAA